MPTNAFNRRSSTHVDSPVTSENGSTSGISGSGSSNGSDATLVNAEETYTSSLFQTEPLYQFYDVSGGSHTIKVRIKSKSLYNSDKYYSGDLDVLIMILKSYVVLEVQIYHMRHCISRLKPVTKFCVRITKPPSRRSI